MYKIEAIVSMNGGEALVLSEKPKITYEKYGNVLLGLDEHGVFAGNYIHEAPSERWKAFAGRKFDIPMSDGSIIKAERQWWDGGLNQFKEILGCNIIHATARDIVSLKNCYVFCGYSAVEEEYIKLRETYTGKIYEYREYERKIIKSRVKI